MDIRKCPNLIRTSVGHLICSWTIFGQAISYIWQIHDNDIALCISLCTSVVAREHLAFRKQFINIVSNDKCLDNFWTPKHFGHFWTTALVSIGLRIGQDSSNVRILHLLLPRSVAQRRWWYWLERALCWTKAGMALIKIMVAICVWAHEQYMHGVVCLLICSFINFVINVMFSPENVLNVRELFTVCILFFFDNGIRL